MTRPAPVLRALARTTRTISALRWELSDQRIRNLMLEARLARVERERDQARQDAELLSLMAKDHTSALGFLRDAHRIDRGEVT